MSLASYDARLEGRDESARDAATICPTAVQKRERPEPSLVEKVPSGCQSFITGYSLSLASLIYHRYLAS